MANQAGADPERTRSVARAAWPRPSWPGFGAPDAHARDLAAARRIRHRWIDLYDLVLDLERYPDFVPRCRAVKVYSRDEASSGCTVIVSRMTVGIAGFDVSYANRTTGDAVARRITVTALDGPLRELNVLWTFEPNGEEWTRVGFSVDYAFESAILEAVAARAFDAMFGEILTAFERRANRLYGPAGAGA
jgi:coenzyme Q-binding protein COQ10